MQPVKASVALALLLAVALGLTACQSQPTPTAAPTQAGAPTQAEVPTQAEAPTEASIETMSPVARSVRLDPANGDADSLAVDQYVYEGLTRLEGDKPAPGLAARWQASDDGLAYTFVLRPGLVFHDGTLVNSEAVAANFNRWFDPADPLRGSGDYAAWAQAFLGFKGEVDADGHPKSSFDGIEKVDDLTFIIHLNRQDDSLLTRLAQPAFGIVNPATLASAGDKFSTSADTSIGAGPYYVDSWDGDAIVLQPFANYWNGAPASGLEFPLK